MYGEYYIVVRTTFSWKCNGFKLISKVAGIAIDNHWLYPRCMQGLPPPHVLSLGRLQQREDLGYWRFRYQFLSCTYRNFMLIFFPTYFIIYFFNEWKFSSFEIGVIFSFSSVNMGQIQRTVHDFESSFQGLSNDFFRIFNFLLIKKLYVNVCIK